MSDHQVWNELGNVYTISGELEQAINAYNKALEMNPKSGWAHNNIALAYIRSGQPHKAIEHYQRSIELFESFPDKAEAWHRLGNAYDILGDIKNTLLAFERSTELAPEKDEYHNSLVSVLEKLPDEMQESFEKEHDLKLAEREEEETTEIPSIPAEVQENLIPKPEDEPVDLEPGIEELMNKLSEEIEREVNKESSVEKETTEQPRWLDIDSFENDESPFAETDKLDENSADLITFDVEETEENEVEVEETVENEETEEIIEELEAETFEPASEIIEDNKAEDIEETEELEILEEIEVVEFESELPTEDKELTEEDIFEEEPAEQDEDIAVFENELEENDVEELTENEEELDEVVEEEVVTLEKEITEATEEDLNVDEAVEPTENAMKNAGVWGEMGNIFFTSDAYDGALIAYEKALELDGDYGAVMHNIALLHMNRGEYKQAIEFYQKSIDILEDSAAQAITWNHLGNAYRALKDYENASEAYRKADEINIETAAFESNKCQDILSTKLT